jgi:hypothetical protein
MQMDREHCCSFGRFLFKRIKKVYKQKFLFMIVPHRTLKKIFMLAAINYKLKVINSLITAFLFLLFKVKRVREN